MSKNNFLDLSDFNLTELNIILALAKKLKADPYNNILPQTQLAMIFEKSSTRTRVSFEVGIKQLGGDATILNSSEMQLGKGEEVSDTAKVLSRYVDIIMIRANKHQDVLELAHNSTVPVINGLTDFNHPCQILTDIFTYIEHRNTIKDKIICWIGDGNNMCNSWLNAALVFGFKLKLALKESYYPNNNLLEKANKAGLVEVFTTPLEAAQSADLVTTDTWVSMGDKNIDNRLATFQDFQVNQAIMDQAKNDALFMHCLPAYRGKEVTSEVIDGKKSVIFDEAENRLHVQKAIMVYLLKGNI
jgi:ornithine carbamoyltransferase